VLKLERRRVEPELDDEYRLIGVYSFGKGIFHREPASGADLGNFRFFSVVAGDLVLSNIQAWEGAIAFATAKDQGTIGTHRFLTYVPVRDRIDANWARWFFLSEPGMALIRQAAPGTTMRNRTLSIERFENLVIPLPDIGLQIEAASHLDRTAALAKQLQASLRETTDVAAAFIDGWLGREFALMTSERTFGDLADVRRGRGPDYEPGSGCFAVNQACVRWNGLDLSQAREVSATWYVLVPDTGRVAPNDVLVNSTGEGTIGRATAATPPAFGLPFDSHVLAARPKADAVAPEFLVAYLRSPQGQDQIARSKGANTTKQTELGKKKLESLPVICSDRQEQELLIARLRRLEIEIGELSAVNQRRVSLAASLLPSAMNDVFVGLT
jgi:type I restriction enzyme S subunit